MEKLKKFRRDLHQIPEVGLEEFKTQEYLISALTKMGYSPRKIYNTGLYVYQDYGSNETIMFRSDIDALPINESNDIAFKSIHSGFMHACGHDGHMAMLLGFADFLKDQTNLKRNVLLVFQPAEEGPGGAYEIVKTGLLEQYNVQEVYGIHLFPNYPEGTIVAKSGPMMASITMLDVTIRGMSSHVAMPNEGIDALYYGALFYAEITYKLSESIKDKDYILKFGKMQSGTVRNIVSNLTTFEGTIRTFSNEIKERIIDIITDIKFKYEQLYGVIIEIKINDLYPAVINDETLFDRFKKLVEPNYPFKILDEPLMISEDFSFYQQAVKGVFYFLGTNNPDLGYTYL
ncbi:MAG: amidohydrolase, partial [Bacilli bacterium]|nr:amidohydrolase [Bacilli bacterium]